MTYTISSTNLHILINQVKFSHSHQDEDERRQNMRRIKFLDAPAVAKIAPPLVVGHSHSRFARRRLHEARSIDTQNDVLQNF